MDGSTLADQWRLASDMAQGAGSILSVVLAGWAAIAVQRYTKRKDRLDFLNHKWSIQQDINLHTIGDPDIALRFERMVYGDSAPHDAAQAHRRFALFLIINLVQSDWFAFREGMITEDEFAEFAAVKLSLIARERNTVEYLLEHRGYTKDFADEVKRLLGNVAPPPPFPELHGDPELSG